MIILMLKSSTRKELGKEEENLEEIEEKEESNSS
jgi:hypothetical protein